MCCVWFDLAILSNKIPVKHIHWYGMVALPTPSLGRRDYICDEDLCCYAQGHARFLFISWSLIHKEKVLLVLIFIVQPMMVFLASIAMK
jgi:hypothetical protein